MIAGIFHSGSGLGNQLHRYVGTRVLALDKGEMHGMVAPELFKGSSFMKLDMGVPTGLSYRIEYPAGRVMVDNPSGVEIIDREFQGENDFMHRLDEVREWLKVKPVEMPDDLCIIGFRGGEYVGVPDLFLPRSYWMEAMATMRQLHPGIKFHVVTDDISTAKQMFSGLELIISHEIGMDWSFVRHARHLIIANSSFYILPALLGGAQEIIAPKYWAGYNKGYWQRPENQYVRFSYI
jgi:hypothetical protein